jgi:hypothetical protein
MTPVMASDGIQDSDVTLLSYLILSGSHLMPVRRNRAVAAVVAARIPAAMTFRAR